MLEALSGQYASAYAADGARGERPSGIRARGEEALGELAQALLENPSSARRSRGRSGAGERAASGPAQRRWGPLNLASRLRRRAARAAAALALRPARGDRGPARRARRRARRRCAPSGRRSGEPRPERRRARGRRPPRSARSPSVEQRRLRAARRRAPASRRRAGDHERRSDRHARAARRPRTAPPSPDRRRGPAPRSSRAASSAVAGVEVAAGTVSTRAARRCAAVGEPGVGPRDRRARARGWSPSPASADRATHRLARSSRGVERRAGPIRIARRDPERRRARRARPPRSAPPIPVDWTVSSRPAAVAPVVAPEPVGVVRHPRLVESAPGRAPSRSAGVGGQQGVGGDRGGRAQVGRSWAAD